MNDTSYNDTNRPRLKKVKRPIRRPEASSGFANIPYEEPSYQESLTDDTVESFDLDEYLDEDVKSNNVPAMQTYFAENQVPEFIEDKDLYTQTPVNIPAWFTKRNVAIMMLATFVCGIIFAKIFFSEAKVVRDGLQGVIPNAEVPRGRARCGLADKTQGCILYLMNPQRQELSARDFYDLASQLTGRQRFVIETGNMRYSNTKIRPGEIGQFNIPPL